MRNPPTQRAKTQRIWPHYTIRPLTVILLFLLLSFAEKSPRALAGGTTTHKGVINGAAYLAEVPASWNGTLLLYSHGYLAPGTANPARDAGDDLTRGYLLSQGFALAGSAYSSTGWALEQAFRDQIALLDWFEKNVARPKRTIAWGHSLGGIITAGLIQQFPERFAAALPMCGVLAGGVGIWNMALDSAFTFKTLLAPSSGLQLVNITNTSWNLLIAQEMLAKAQLTAQGRARLALAFAMADVPGWFVPTLPEPAADDFNSREFNQYLWAQESGLLFNFVFRAELERRAGGNPSWNTGVDYRKQLELSVNRDEVVALYRQAGLSLNADLQTLANTPRIASSSKALSYLTQNITFDGQLRMPVLTMHTTGDGLVPVQNEEAYASVVRAAGSQKLLRQLFVRRAGHCAFTAAETITALQALVRRLDTGAWDALDPQALNQKAATLGASLNVLPIAIPIRASPAFAPYHPAPFLRPFDRRAKPLTLNGLPNRWPFFRPEYVALKNEILNVQHVIASGCT